MIDIGLIRENPGLVKDSLKKRGLNEKIVEEISVLDELWRKSIQKLELLQAESNRLSKNKDSAQQNRSKLAELKNDISAVRKKSSETQRSLHQKLLSVPNIVFDGVPAGGADNNQILDSRGTPDGEKTTAHEDILAARGMIAPLTAATFSGSRFRYLIRDAAGAARKLFDLAIEFAKEEGFVLVVPPVVAREELLEMTGFFPSGKDDAFSLGDDQYLVGTSEPLLLALAANSKITAGKPLRYVGFSTCFRKEAGSYGKDVKGIFRVHQFDKVELVSIVGPEDSEKEHEFLISMQEKLVKKLGLPYRKVLLAAGDQSQIAAKQVDIECWFPSQQRYRETHSASNCTDFQSRLLKIKCERDGASGLAHTLNATLATERLLLAVVENNFTSGKGKELTINWPKELIS